MTLKSNWVLERQGIACYSIRLLKGINTLGRFANATIKIPSLFTSKLHCEIFVDNKENEEIVTVTDHSSNGTFINENKVIMEKFQIHNNDKIGFGVVDVDDKLDTDTQYHVYRLRNINIKKPPQIMVPAIIDIFDSEDEEMVLTKLSNKITQNKNSNKNDKTEKTETDNIKIISNISVPNLYPNENQTANENNVSEVFNIFDSDDENESKIVETFNKIEVTQNNDDINQFDNIQNQSSEILIISDSEEEAKEKIIDNLTDKLDSKANIKTFNYLEIDEDDEDFNFSQCMLDNIKQEVNDLDNDYYSNDKIFFKNEHNIKSSPIYDLEYDEDEEFDEITTNWIEKLSQNNEIKKEIILELNDDNECEAENKEYDEKTSNSVEKLLQNNETTGKIEVDLNNDQECETENNKLDQKTSDCVDNDNNVDQDFDAELIIDQSIILDSKIGDIKKYKNKIPQIIESIHLPVHKGKLRGVSANTNLKIQKANLKKIEDKQVLTKTTLWQQKPNKFKEKLQKKMIKDLRKEKLKIIANKDSTGSKTKLNESTTQESNKLLKAKVKVTRTNRGAFLTEEQMTSKLNMKLSKTINNIKKNTTLKEKSVKLIPSLQNTLETEKNKQFPLKRPSICDKDVEIPKKMKPSTSNETKPITSDIEMRPGKLTFKCLPNYNKNKSILIKTNWRTNEIKKTVRFNDHPQIRYFESENTKKNEIFNLDQSKLANQKDAKFDFSRLGERRRLSFQHYKLIDYSDTILTEILSWDPIWLENGTEQVNGPDHVLLPMMHCFKSLEEYENTIFPLMKLELWVRLHKDCLNNMNELMEIELSSFQIDDKTLNKRIILNCICYNEQFSGPNFLYSGDFLVLRIGKMKIFGYIRGFQIIRNSRSPHFIFLIEILHNKNLSDLLHNIKNITLKKISSIVVELGEFNSIKRLKSSKLLTEILNPMKLIKDENISINNIKYIGYTQTLNDKQKEILVRTYLKCINPLKSNLSLIEGPPGTGKSVLILNLILQILYGKEVRFLDRKLLICAPSNAAIDEITLKLIHVRQKMKSSEKFKLVRFGVVDRMHPNVKSYSITSLINNTRKMKSSSSYNQEKLLIKKKINAIEQNNNPNSVDKDELNKLKLDYNRIKESLIDSQKPDFELYPKYLLNANVICTTLSSCVKLLKYLKFIDICIIDESTQCKEPWSLIPLQFDINSLVLVGDKQQLPPTVLSQLSKNFNYGKSLFVRMQECLENNTNNNPIMSLKTQYRMHPEICHWPNLYFYKNQLINGLKNIPPIPFKPYTILSLDYLQNNLSDCNGKITNSEEGCFVVKLVKHLIEKLPLSKFKYGIITPYYQQRVCIQKTLFEDKITDIEVQTIDSFQGKEKDVIIISNTRTNGVGFLKETSRLNVSLTRAKICLILCGNFSQLDQIPVWKSLLDDAKSRKIYYSITKEDAEHFELKVMNKIKNYV